MVLRYRILLLLAVLSCPFAISPQDKSGHLDQLSHFQGIDTHIHLYDTRREGSSVFLDPVKHARIYFPHFPQQFRDISQSSGIGEAVVIEASKRRVDNFWLAQLSDTSNAIVAFIANLDPRDSTFVKDIDSLSTFRKFRGIRLRPQTKIDLSDELVIDRLSELNKRNLVLELGGNGQVIAEIARKYPNMHIIIDHMAGGQLINGIVNPDDWESRLKTLADEPNIYCKISMLHHLSGENPAPVNLTHYLPLIDPVVDNFGPNRVMFGSNWSLSEMRGTYENMIKILKVYCLREEHLSTKQLFMLNAHKAYHLK